MEKMKMITTLMLKLKCLLLCHQLHNGTLGDTGNPQTDLLPRAQDMLSERRGQCNGLS